jgi:protein phosphatase
MRRLGHTDYPVVALTHPGMKGKNNEDCFGVSSFGLEPFGPWPVLLAVICDGIGGHRAGEVAAEIAVETISREVGRSNAADPPQILSDAVQAASDAIFARASSSPEQSGMGATCACAWIIGEQLYTASVGDSRLYLLRGETIRQLSTDHTWVQEAIERGILKPGQASGHPNQHVIRRYLGGPTPPEVDLRLRLQDDENDEQAEANQGLLLLPGDLVLLTSDGLTDLISDPEILAAYHPAETTPTALGTRAASIRSVPTEEAGSRLIDLANERGGHDNITLIAITVPERKKISRPREWIRRNGGWIGGGCAGLLLVLLLALGLAGGWWWTNLTTETPGGATPTSPVVETTGPNSADPAPTALIPPPAFTTATPTPAAVLPLDAGPTLTPWPTNTSGN